MRWVILKWRWQPATKLPTPNGMLTLFMNTKCHQFPLDQIISGDRCVSVCVCGGGVCCTCTTRCSQALPTPALPQFTWLCVQFPSVGRRQVHLILVQVLLQISDRLLDGGCQVCSKPNGTLWNVKSPESQLIFFFQIFCFPCSLLKSIIRGKLAGVERNKKISLWLLDPVIALVAGKKGFE